MRNGDVSFWWRQIGIPAARAPLPGDVDVDVCVVGAGFTGLWTAYYLRLLDPSVRVAVVEARFAGFGASGRNGGWLTNSVTGGRERYGRDGGTRQQAALNDTVDEVIRVAADEGIDADVVKGGELNVAYTPAQLTRLRAFVRDEARWPGTDACELSPAETVRRVGVHRPLGSVWQPHCARIHPAKLVRGLAQAVERRGAVIYEDTAVREITPHRVRTDRGVVRAEHVVRATEGFTANLRGRHRRWLPLNSSLIVTDPLPDRVWARIGWEHADTLGDLAHVYTYAQRTADGRIAFGGRGVPYRYGSRIDADGRTRRRTVVGLARLLHTAFPEAGGARIAHAWSGVLGVPRDWAASVGHDRRSGLAWAGGYVGTGVAATNLAGRCVADLVAGRDTELVHLPWVGHRAKDWEPEPLRWLAVNAVYAAYGIADRQEARGRATTSPVARVADLVSGH